MYFNPSLILIDLVRLLIAYAMYYYITRLEQIKCLKQPSWKPTFIKFYSVVNIILIVLSTLSPSPNTLDVQGVITAINLPLSIILIYTIYTYVRELETEFKNCNLSQNMELVHEFLKLYSLLSVLALVFIVLIGVSVALSFIKFPKYMSIQNKMNNELRLKMKKKHLQPQSQSQSQTQTQSNSQLQSKNKKSAINKAVKRVSKDKIKKSKK